MLNWQGTDGGVRGEASQAHGLCSHCCNPGQSDILDVLKCTTLSVSVCWCAVLDAGNLSQYALYSFL